ncbi:hypothetical protein BC827DRAFT_416040 [Russula dissimulans]|nr:hypothetical protein BC827DRAFT_416040 [Russula dissimulans]
MQWHCLVKFRAAALGQFVFGGLRAESFLNCLLGVTKVRQAPSPLYCPCALSGTDPSTEHHELLAQFSFNCYQTSYTVQSTLSLHVHQFSR